MFRIKKKYLEQLWRRVTKKIIFYVLPKKIKGIHYLSPPLDNFFA